MYNFIYDTTYDEVMSKTLHYLVDVLPMANNMRYQLHELIEFCSNAKRVHTIINIV